MNSNANPPEISKEAFVKAREKLGLTTKELGGMACLSIRQIEQIESGEMGSFYSAQIKYTAAKKVAKLLKLSDEEAFDCSTQTQDVLTVSSVEPSVAQTPKTDEESLAPPVGADIAEESPQSKELPKENPEALDTVKAESKPKPKKNLFLWFSVIAAAVFAAINLRPMLSADKPQEIILVKEEVVEPAPVATPAEPTPTTATPVTPLASAPAVPATPVTATTADVSAVCPAEEGIISYKPEAPRKAGDMVYVQVKSKQVVCVSDASGKMQNKMLEPGVGASFYGKPPFKVLTGGLAQADIFFQGAKVRLTNSNYKTLVLEAAEVLTSPVDRTDSQQR